MQQIADNLAQPRRITVDPDRTVAGHQSHDNTIGVGHIAIIFHRLGDDRIQVAAFLAQQYLAVSQPCGVEQVVDQPPHMANLAVHGVAHRRHAWIRRRQHLLQLQAVIDGAQRIAQFVSQHTEELVLALVGLTDLVHQHDVFQRHTGAIGQVCRQRRYRNLDLARAEDQDTTRFALYDQG